MWEKSPTLQPLFYFTNKIIDFYIKSKYIFKQLNVNSTSVVNQAFCETMKWKISPGSREALFSLPSLCNSCCPFFFLRGKQNLWPLNGFRNWVGSKEISEHFTWFCCLVGNLLWSFLFFTKSSSLFQKTNFSICTVHTNRSCFLVTLKGKVFKARMWKSSFKYNTTAFIKSWPEPAQKWAYDVPYGSLQRETHHSRWIVGAMQEGVRTGSYKQLSAILFPEVETHCRGGVGASCEVESWEWLREGQGPLWKSMPPRSWGQSFR